LRRSPGWDGRRGRRSGRRERPRGRVPVLDTDILTVVQRRIEPEYSAFVGRASRFVGGPIVTTVVSFEEQLRGWLEYVKRAKPAQLPAAYAKLAELNRDFSTRPVLPFDGAALAVYERLAAARPRVGAMDLRIAAVAIANDEVLVSRNLQHFRKVPGLRVEDWTR
jgi:tRNA(fMet)-specific endonuclease VapC